MKHAIVQRSLQHSAAPIGWQNEKVKCHQRCGFHHRPFQLCKNTPTTLWAPAVNWSMLSGQNLLFHLCGAKYVSEKSITPRAFCSVWECVWAVIRTTAAQTKRLYFAYTKQRKSITKHFWFFLSLFYLYFFSVWYRLFILFWKIWFLLTNFFRASYNECQVCFPQKKKKKSIWRTKAQCALLRHTDS